MGNTNNSSVLGFLSFSSFPDLSVLNVVGNRTEEENTSTGIRMIRDDKYANLGSPESRRIALMSVSLQAFLSEAMSTMDNGGSRDDQEITFSCGLAANYPLQFAAMIGDVNKILYLVKECGIDPNMKCIECLDVQPVSLASRYGHLLAVIALLKKGADPFEINKSGQNALSESYKEGHLHITYFLKEIARRLKAYFAAKRLSSQLNIECCEHCLDRSYCRVCTWGDMAAAEETESCCDSECRGMDAVSVVTEHMGGTIRSSLPAGMVPSSSTLTATSPTKKLFKVRSDLTHGRNQIFGKGTGSQIGANGRTTTESPSPASPLLQHPIENNNIINNNNNNDSGRSNHQ